MFEKKKAVLGIYHARKDVEAAVRELEKEGFAFSDISILLPKSLSADATKAPEGAVTGAMIGGALGLLASAGFLVIPGLGPFLAAGPLMSALTALGIGGALGGVSGALMGWGVPEDEAKRYEAALESGRILLTVHTESADWRERARASLERTGAENITTISDESLDRQKTHPYSTREMR